MAAVAPSAPALLSEQGAPPSRKHRASSSQPSTSERITSRKLFGRARKPPPTAELTLSTDSAVYSKGALASSPHKSNHSSNGPSDDDKVFSSRDTNLSTSALSSFSTTSRTSRFFRRFARQKPPPVPSLPPALVLDLDAGTAVPRSAHGPSSASTGMDSLDTTNPSQPPTPAAAIIAESNAAYAAAETVPKPHGLQRAKMLEALANARLDVSHTRDLVRMCGLQIRERGLDTSGLFRPFRITESPDHVYHMIQLFLLSIDVSTYISVFSILPENALDRLDPNHASNSNASSSQEAKSRIARQELDKELRYAAPHDVVSVMKWGLRHMRMHPSDLHSKDADEWYDVFVAAERDSGYHPRAIADLLHPKLPQATAELLSEVLDLMASVAAHASSNHMPASALCKVLGFWLFGRVGVAHPPPTVDELVEVVNKASAMAEHLLLAHIRSQAAVTFSMPLRLTELIERYPHLNPGAEAPSLPPSLASRTVPTLRIDLRSENLVVSQVKPRSPSSILADALDASASDGITGGHGDKWAALIMQLDHAAVERTGKGYDLLIDEHVRILRQVQQEMQGADKDPEAGTNQNTALTSAANAAAPASAATPVTPAAVKANRRRSQSLSDLRANLQFPSGARALAPLPEASSSGTNTPRATPKRKPVPLFSEAEAPGAEGEAEAVEVVVEPAAAPHKDLFLGGLEPSASWRSFSEEGFGAMSSASSDLSLSEFDLTPIQTLPTRRSHRSLYRVRSSTSHGSRRKLAPQPTSTVVDGAAGTTHVVTAARMCETHTALAVLWQDQLLDPSPCCRLPSMLFVQLNARTATAMETGSSTQDVPRYPGDAPWLLVVETVIPPRPPTPPMPAKGQGWNDDAEKRSLFAPSIKSVRMRLRRVSTVIGSGMRRKTSATETSSHAS